MADFNFRAATKMGILPWPLRIQTDGLGEAITLSSGFAMQYWSSLYWSVTTLVKVPWIRPRTTPELVFAAFVVVTGTFTFSVLIGQVTMLQKAWDMSRQARTDRIGKMRDENLNPPLANQSHSPLAPTPLVSRRPLCR